MNFSEGPAKNDVVADNDFTGGSIGNLMTYDTQSEQYSPLNVPEVILTENYGVAYQGPVGAISSDGYVLVLPPPSTSVSSRGGWSNEAGTGTVVSIMNVENSNGSANPLVGDWFVIAQQISASPPTFLMQSPIPVGSYVISIAGGDIDDQYTGNNINIANKVSTGIDLPGRNTARRYWTTQSSEVPYTRPLQVPAFFCSPPELMRYLGCRRQARNRFLITRRPIGPERLLST